MRKYTLLILVTTLFSLCQNKPKGEIECFPATEESDKMLHITTINSVGDTLFRIENRSKNTVLACYKGDSIRLRKDSIDDSFSNGIYTFIEKDGNTLLYKHRKIIFQNPLTK